MKIRILNFRIITLLVSVIAIPLIAILVIEAGLYFAYRVTSLGIFNTLVSTQNQYLRHRPYSKKKDCKKIAVFGGSTMAGFSAELPTAVILEYELSRQPGCYFIKNLADSGAYMYKYGQPLLTDLDRFYDLFLIYSGHNEIHSLLDDTGITRIISEEVDSDRKRWGLTRNRIISEHYAPGHSRLPKNFPSGTHLSYLLATHSRTFALISRIKSNPKETVDRIIEKLLRGGGEIKVEPADGSTPNESNVEPTRQPWPNVVEKTAIVDGIEDFPSLYTKMLSKLNSSKTIISTVSGDLFFPPSWSVGNKNNAHFYYDRGIDKLKKTGVIDWRDFEMANSLDGFPMRVLSGVNSAIKTSGLQVIDFDKAIKDRIEDTGMYRHYFNDIQHLSNVGHILLSRKFLCAMDFSEYCTFASYASLENMEQTFLSKIYSKWKLKDLRIHNAITSIFWSYRLGGFTSCPLCFVKRSQNMAEQLLGNNAWRYQKFVQAVSDSDNYRDLENKDIYNFIDYLPRTRVMELATQNYFVGNLEKLGVCRNDGHYVGCMHRVTRTYNHVDF